MQRGVAGGSIGQGALLSRRCTFLIHSGPANREVPAATLHSRAHTGAASPVLAGRGALGRSGGKHSWRKEARSCFVSERILPLRQRKEGTEELLRLDEASLLLRINPGVLRRPRAEASRKHIEWGVQMSSTG